MLGLRPGIVWLAPLLAFAQITPGPKKIGSVVVQGSIRTRVEGWDWFQTDGADSGYAYSGTLVRLSFGQTRRSLDWQFELAAPVLAGLPDNALAPAPQGALGAGASYFTANQNSRTAGMVFPKQAFVRFKGLFGDESQNVRVGRFEFIDGSEIIPRNASLAAMKRERIAHRLLGNFGWTHIGRSFDGFHYVANKHGISIHLLGAAPTRGVFQVDGWGALETAFGYASLNGQFNGKKHSGDWRLLGLYYHDWRDVLKTDNRSLPRRSADLANLRLATFGGHYLHAVETGAGTVDATFWGVLQTGRWGSLDHRAGAVAIEAGWQPPVWRAVRPWIRAGYFYGSGDPNPNDNTHSTFFQVLPTARIYARFPFYNLMNNEDLSGTLTLRPAKSITVKSEYHYLRLAVRTDLWYAGGGAFQPWSFGYAGRPSGGSRNLSGLYDASVDWTVNPHASITCYYGYADGRRVVESIYPRGSSGSLGYVELTYRF
jgi:hypothetical protein